MSTKLVSDLEYSREMIAQIGQGERIRGIVRGVSGSGLTHYVTLVYPNGKGELLNLTYAVAVILGYKVSDYHGYNTIKMHGGGYDKVFQLVYELGLMLHGDGYYYGADIL